MKQNIQIKILQQSGSLSGITNYSTVISNYVTNLEIPSGSTISEVKTICKSNISGSDGFTVLEEVMWFGSNKSKDDDVFKYRSGYEYNIFIKK